MAELNRFDYFSDIEDTFVRLRGKALNLSPLDWQLIESWKVRGVPLHVVIRSIEEVFDNHKAKARRRPIQSLSYCRYEVEAQYAEYLQMRVGSHESEPGAVATGSADPFPKEKVIAHLQDAAHALVIKVNVPEGCEETFAEALDALGQLEVDFEELPDARKLEDELTKIERNLDVAIESGATPEQIAEARAAAEELYGPYKNKMLPQIYQQQIDNELKRRLRAIFGVPRLSLFHMK